MSLLRSILIYVQITSNFFPSINPPEAETKIFCSYNPGYFSQRHFSFYLI